jgi:lysophospholipase L1-like esterase
VFLSCVALSITAQAQPAEPVSPATSSITEPNGTRYKPGLWLAAQQQKIDAMKGACDLLFIGDSITFAWDGQLWKKHLAPRRALNYGIPGDNVQNVLFRLDYPGLKAIQPKVAVILIGTNNGGPAAETAAGILAVVNKTRALFPAAKIILMDLLPTARRSALVMAVNERIQTYADNETVFRLNLGERMIREGDSWVGLGPDKLHLSSAGYAIWDEMLAPLLVRFLGPLPEAKSAP